MFWCISSPKCAKQGCGRARRRSVAARPFCTLPAVRVSIWVKRDRTQARAGGATGLGGSHRKPQGGGQPAEGGEGRWSARPAGKGR
jgi:hypothetical protein